MNTCKHCSSISSGNYCSNCGQPVKLKRIDGNYMKQEIGSILYIEKGFLYTVKNLLIRPGQSVKMYLSENRSKHVKPIVFIIVTSIIYALMNHYLHFEDSYISYEGLEESAVSKILQWGQRNYGYFNIIIALFIAFWTKIFFKKQGYNFFEVLILICYVMGIGMLIFTLFGIIEGITKAPLLFTAFLFVTAYSIWAVGQFFGGKPGSYLKAFLANILGNLIFILLIVFVGLIVDFIF